MLSGLLPFDEEEHPISIKNKLMSSDFDLFDDDVWNNHSAEAKNLIRRMLSMEESRPSAEECLADPWF